MKQEVIFAAPTMLPVQKGPEHTAGEDYQVIEQILINIHFHDLENKCMYLGIVHGGEDFSVSRGTKCTDFFLLLE